MSMTGSHPRVEVLAGPERRRRWSVAEKLEMVAEIALKSLSEKIPRQFRLCRLCGARSKNRNGELCRQPAMANGRCRFHGGKTPPTPKGSKFALKHGLFTAEAVAQRRKAGAALRATYELLKQVDDRVMKRSNRLAADRARRKQERQQRAAMADKASE